MHSRKDLLTVTHHSAIQTSHRGGEDEASERENDSERTEGENERAKRWRKRDEKNRDSVPPHRLLFHYCYFSSFPALLLPFKFFVTACCMYLKLYFG
jgi:hypothetical protein